MPFFSYYHASLLASLLPMARSMYLNKSTCYVQASNGTKKDKGAKAAKPDVASLAAAAADAEAAQLRAITDVEKRTEQLLDMVGALAWRMLA